MGDIADMMIEGVLCSGCGEVLGDGGGLGYPGVCGGCDPDDYPGTQRAPVDKVYCERCPGDRHFDVGLGKPKGVRMRRVKKGYLFTCNCGHIFRKKEI